MAGMAQGDFIILLQQGCPYLILLASVLSSPGVETDIQEPFMPENLGVGWDTAFLKEEV